MNRILLLICIAFMSNLACMSDCEKLGLSTLPPEVIARIVLFASSSPSRLKLFASLNKKTQQFVIDFLHSFQASLSDHWGYYAPNHVKSFITPESSTTQPLNDGIESELLYDLVHNEIYEIAKEVGSLPIIISPDFSYIIMSKRDKKTLALVDYRNQMVLHKKTIPHEISKIVISPNGKYFTLRFKDIRSAIRLYDSSFNLIWKVGGYQALFNKDSSLVVVWNHGILYVYDTKSEYNKYSLYAINIGKFFDIVRFRTMKFLNDSYIIVYVIGLIGETTLPKQFLWDFRNKDEKAQLNAYSGVVMSCDGQFLAWGNGEIGVAIEDKINESIFFIDKAELFCKGQVNTFIIIYKQQQFEIVDLKTKESKVLYEYNFDSINDMVDIKISSDNSTIILVIRSILLKSITIIIFNAKTAKILSKLRIKGGYEKIIMNPDGKTICFFYSNYLSLFTINQDIIHKSICYKESGLLSKLFSSYTQRIQPKNILHLV